MQMQVTTGRYHTLLVHNSSVYSCGSNLCGVLGHGQDTTQCAAFSRINFPSLSHVIHISASHNHAAFITLSGEVFTCGDNSSFCCGHGEVGRTIFKPSRIEALKGIPCKQVYLHHHSKCTNVLPNEYVVVHTPHFQHREISCIIVS
ncbi:hypothetical protein B296_00052650 [Ensete ventricosum]|uniref:Uncharacterized protein n=1 Tax=Ensete ventricosum TaxID=4639 RepID=A0A426Y4E2_ENSVE|nr:hypothetical protein B296_00052650 [Ensete ventricosum]